MNSLMKIALGAVNESASTAAVDTVGNGMTLVECALSVSTVIHESIGDLFGSVLEKKDAAVTAISESAGADTDALMEGIMGTIKEKVTAGLERILEAIKKVIAKIKQVLDSHTKSGTYFVSQYESKIPKDLSGLNWSTFPFDKAKIEGMTVANHSVEGFLKAEGVDSISTFYASLNGKEGEDLKTAKKAGFDKISGKSVEVAEMKKTYFHQITKIEPNSNDSMFRQLYDELRGGKSEPEEKKGLSPAELEEIKNNIKSGKSFTAIKADYEKLAAETETAIKTINAGTTESKENSAANSAKLDYLKSYTGLMTNIMEIAHRINSERLRAAEDQYDTCLRTFKKAVSHKVKGEKDAKDSNSFVDDFSFEVEVAEA